jgi:hypothetical protein
MASTQSGKGIANINNLNIVTFIKDIYQSLKHIDQCFNTIKTDIDARMVKLEINQQVIIERITNLELLITQIGTKISDTEKIDKTLENELLDKMFLLNCSSEADMKTELKPKELTIANIMENGYTLLDINKTLTDSFDSLDSNQYKPVDLTDDSNSLSLNLESLEGVQSKEYVQSEEYVQSKEYINNINKKISKTAINGIQGNGKQCSSNLDSLLFD